jgi:hypothetical protein
MLAHRTLYSSCPVRHRTSRRAQKTELQWSEPNGFGDVAVAPDMSGAPEDSNFKLVTFGNFQRPLCYNSPDCPVYTGHVRCSKEGRPQELASLGFSLQLLR